MRKTDVGDGSQRTKCSRQFRFIKDDFVAHQSIKSIRGTITVTQNANKHSATGYFDVGMIPHWELSSQKEPRMVQKGDVSNIILIFTT